LQYTTLTGMPKISLYCDLQVFYSAPGRIRTCDRRIRSPLLCPLSYGRIWLIYTGFSPRESSRNPLWQQCGSNSAQKVGSQRLVHGVGQAAVHPLDDVRVGIEGDGYAGVAEKLLDVFRVLACHEEYCSAGVAKVIVVFVVYSGDPPLRGSGRGRVGTLVELLRHEGLGQTRNRLEHGPPR
jgi:hypothetical protein